MASHEVLSIISSLHGAFNGEFPTKQIGVQILSETEAIYTLTEWVIGETGLLEEKVGEEKFLLTLTPMEVAPEPIEEDVMVDDAGVEEIVGGDDYV